MSENEYGINSLRGFAFQIKVFLYYLTKLDDSDRVEFETIDDIAINKSDINKSIDSNSCNMKTIISGKNEIEAVQVKQTSLSNSKNKRIIFNWLLTCNDIKISKYILFTDAEYHNDLGIFDSINVDDLYSAVIKSDKKSTALISQVKKIYIDEEEKFTSDFNEIKSKYESKSIKGIDEKIYENCEAFFHKEGISEIKYNLRVMELFSIITANIIDSISQKKPYTASKQYLMKLSEQICNNISDEIYKPNFATFRKLQNIDIKSTEISRTREYKQLVACELPNERIEKHLIYKQYYFDYRIRELENISSNITENLEETTYENFCDARESLAPSDDVPKKRLSETKNRNNSYCYDDQIRYGSCIYLTGDNINKEVQISWEDE
ncbi:MAG: hypothetical protein PQJ44_07580 [Sphaerochaetaceae bacterium]|nr:hypothetical protein [Sphaerochaetaceae bacterium]